MEVRQIMFNLNNIKTANDTGQKTYDELAKELSDLKYKFHIANGDVRKAIWDRMWTLEAMLKWYPRQKQLSNGMFLSSDPNISPDTYYNEKDGFETFSILREGDLILPNSNNKRVHINSTVITGPGKESHDKMHERFIIRLLDNEDMNYTNIQEAKNQLSEELILTHGRVKGDTMAIWDSLDGNKLEAIHHFFPNVKYIQQSETELTCSFNLAKIKTAMPIFWGKSASGLLILCLEDQTALLLKRANWVEQPGTWGNPGGAIGGGYYDDNQDDNEEDDDIFEQNAHKETIEELGSLPNNMEYLETIEYKSGSFVYKTFVYNISKEEKERWTPLIDFTDGESTDAQWFSITNLPPNIHFGIKHIMNNSKHFVNEYGIRTIRPETKNASVELGYAGQHNCFIIKTPYGANVSGYVNGQDFPMMKSEETRGEIFYIEVPQSLRGSGIGKSLAKDAINLIKANGCKTVNISTTSQDGVNLVESLKRDGLIGQAINTSQSGKIEYSLS
jgi:8-oxo-dGTP pyrophosphatase MutT (NUDIX family)/predicted GNAT family acetyltransferase